MKFAVISHVMPPSWSGQAVMLSRLLEGLDASEYCLISALAPPASGDQSYSTTLSGRYYHLPQKTFLRRGYRWGLKYVREAINFMLAVRTRARQIAKIIEREKCDAIIACSGDLEDLPAAWLASRKTGVAFYAYYFDYYSHQFTEPEKQVLARLVEPLLLRRAVDIITTNEILSEDLRQRYGVESTVLHLPCDLAQYDRLATASSDDDNEVAAAEEVRIVYTGAIYEAHFDAFRNLLRALEILGRKDVRIHIYTAQRIAELTARGIHGPIVVHDHLHVSKMPNVQRSADILFLPLAFNSAYPVIVRTAAPSKLAEYLASRSAILCHAPADSFVSWYFRHHECGLLVDQSDPKLLATAVEQLLDDALLRRRLGARAWERAQADFDLTKARARFTQLLKAEARKESNLGLALRVND